MELVSSDGTVTAVSEVIELTPELAEKLNIFLSLGIGCILFAILVFGVTMVYKFLKMIF